MSFEKISTSQEKKDVPKLTNEEYLLRFGGDKESFKEWMESEGIEADENGHALIEIDGKIEKVDVTDDIGKIIEIDEEDSEN